MKVTRKFGMSYYTLQLTDDEAAKWNMLKTAPSYIKRTGRDEIFEEAYIRTHFGDKKNLLKALNSLDKDLTKFEKTVNLH